MIRTKIVDDQSTSSGADQPLRIAKGSNGWAGSTGQPNAKAPMGMSKNWAIIPTAVLIVVSSLCVPGWDGKAATLPEWVLIATFYVNYPGLFLTRYPHSGSPFWAILLNVPVWFGLSSLLMMAFWRIRRIAGEVLRRGSTPGQAPEE